MPGAIERKLVPAGIDPGLSLAFDGLALLGRFGAVDPAVREAASGFDGDLVLDVFGGGGAAFTLCLAGGRALVRRGRAPGARASLRVSIPDFFRLLRGEIAPVALASTDEAFEGDARALAVLEAVLAAARRRASDTNLRGRATRAWLALVARLAQTT